MFTSWSDCNSAVIIANLENGHVCGRVIIESATLKTEIANLQRFHDGNLDADDENADKSLRLGCIDAHGSKGNKTGILD